jgi:hypothetical protein
LNQDAPDQDDAKKRKGFVCSEHDNITLREHQGILQQKKASKLLAFFGLLFSGDRVCEAPAA